MNRILSYLQYLFSAFMHADETDAANGRPVWDNVNDQKFFPYTVGGAGLWDIDVKCGRTIEGIAFLGFETQFRMPIFYKKACKEQGLSPEYNATPTHGIPTVYRDEDDDVIRRKFGMFYNSLVETWGDVCYELAKFHKPKYYTQNKFWAWYFAEETNFLRSCVDKAFTRRELLAPYEAAIQPCFAGWEFLNNRATFYEHNYIL
jgi:hypothetical protein